METFKVALSLASYGVAIQINPFQQYFYMELFIFKYLGFVVVPNFFFYQGLRTSLFLLVLVRLTMKTLSIVILVVLLVSAVNSRSVHEGETFIHIRHYPSIESITSSTKHNNSKGSEAFL